MFDFRWLRPVEAAYYAPYSRLKASPRWPHSEHKQQPRQTRAERRRG